MASAATAAIWITILFPSILVLYFFVQSMVPKKPDPPLRMHRNVSDATLPGLDVATEVKSEVVTLTNRSQVESPVVVAKVLPPPQPTISKEQPAPVQQAQPQAPVQHPAEAATPSKRKKSLQDVLVQSALNQLKKKVAEHNPQCSNLPFQSQHNQDWFVILNFFRNLKTGFYVDVGANHFQTISNTWFLDKCLGWKGICVEPNPRLAKLLRANRNCYVYNGCISTKPSNLTLVIPNGVGVAAYVKDTDAPLKRGEVEVSVPCMPLAALLEQQKVKHVNFMSLDVEGHEPKAIASFPTNGPVIDVLSIEISTGRIQRALSQYPLLTRGMVSLVPLVGDAIMVHRNYLAEASGNKLLFPNTPYYRNWWGTLCLKFENLTLPICKRLGLDFMDKPRFAPVTEETSTAQLQDSLKMTGKKDKECTAIAKNSLVSDTFSSRYSQDWFVLKTFYPNGKGANGEGFYVDFVGSGHPQETSNTWFLDHCLGWKGICVAFDAKAAAAYHQLRSCKVVVACVAKHCTDMKCTGIRCPSFGCQQLDDPNCIDIASVLQTSPSVDVLSMNIHHAPLIVGLTEWDHLRKAAVIIVDGLPQTNYKLMHWPLSLRGYALAATLKGNDVFVKRTASLLQRKFTFPTSNSSTVHWLSHLWKVDKGLDDSTIAALLANPH